MIIKCFRIDLYRQCVSRFFSRRRKTRFATVPHDNECRRQLAASMKLYGFVTAAFLFLFAAPSYSEAYGAAAADLPHNIKNQLPPNSQSAGSEKIAADRKSVALVLAGGGAKGFAHIPVLELLEELDIPVDIVIGNSSGAIIGSLYCAGYTPQEIRHKLTTLDWSKIFQDGSHPAFEKTLENHSSYSAPFAVRFGANMALEMGTGILTGQKAYELFKKLTLRIPSYTDFDTLPIPFRAVAVDLYTGEVHVFDCGDLAEAVRASISIPAFFEPFDIDGNVYIDGLARNNLPIDVAHDMGYECIIAVELQAPLSQDKTKFEQNPLVALGQMSIMEQAVRKKKEYAMADIVLFPETESFSLIDYSKAEKIYRRAKTDLERYRDSLAALREKIFSEKQADVLPPHSSALPSSSASVPQSAAARSIEKRMSAYSFAEYPKPKTARDFRNVSYEDLPPIILKRMTVSGTVGKDANYIRKMFSRIKNQPLKEEMLHAFFDSLYATGRYARIVIRLNTNETDNAALEVYLTPVKTKTGLVLLGGNYEGTYSSDSSSSLALSADAQYRGFSGEGSVLSVSASCLNTAAFRMMYMQPLGARFFLRFSAEYEKRKRWIISGWNSMPAGFFISGKKSAEVEFGFPFSEYHYLLSGAGIHHFDTTESEIAGKKTFAGDFSASYTFNLLNHQSFPTKGVYVSARGLGVLPVSDTNTVRIFETAALDVCSAFSFGRKISFVVSGFSGFCFSEQLQKLPHLLPVYGFSDGDRRFFPQIAGTAQFGLHKIVIGGALQFAPWDQITILGGQAFFSVSGAVGNVWQSFADMSLAALHWRASADAGIRITENFSVVLRIGAGTTSASARKSVPFNAAESHPKQVRPFVSFDFGSIRY
ncbi:MAG: patatin-like phospholipase family protein [Bacteroides sp.]|nr:patatin-like phospholipase family protein [Prevotella sp.]MCM1407177.1 patatin-like phospholipase family protein [Treponema brennaborense]MCM1470329.1 patatin-like phospholipase family protein [Bacteroides sp.]